MTNRSSGTDTMWEDKKSNPTVEDDWRRLSYEEVDGFSSDQDLTQD